MPEWVQEQQLILFGQSCLLGVALGFLFDFFNIPSKARRRRRLTVFLCDVLFFVVAAMASFFFSLAVMDGRLHPLLFCGSLLGFVVQHLIVGRVFSRLLYRVARFVYTFLDCIFTWVGGLLSRGFSAILRHFSHLCVKSKKNTRKSQKNSDFFQKNS